MTKEKVLLAKKEAERFIERVNEYEKRFPEQDYLVVGYKETGALKRASMDLSRALSDLRK